MSSFTVPGGFSGCVSEINNNTILILNFFYGNYFIVTKRLPRANGKVFILFHYLLEKVSFLIRRKTVIWALADHFF